MNDVIKKVLELSLKMNCSGQLYLVGGFVRDFERGCKARDIDFVLDDFDAISFGKEISYVFSGKFVLLDAKNSYCRVTIKHQGEDLDLDFSIMRGKTIEDDLLKRDLTINAMALKVEDYISYIEGKSSNKNIIDIFNSREDIDKKIVRLIPTGKKIVDPIIVLRSARAMYKLDYKIDQESLIVLRRSAQKINQPGKGKVLVELWHILDLDQASFALEFLEKETKIFSRLFSEVENMKKNELDSDSKINLWDNGILTVRNLESVYKQLPFNDHLNIITREHLKEKVGESRKRKQLLKFAALFHEIGKIDQGGRYNYEESFSHELAGVPYIERIAKTLLLTDKEILILREIIRFHTRPKYIFKEKNITLGARFRFFKQARDNIIDIVLINLAEYMVENPDILANKKDPFINYSFNFLDEYFYKLNPSNLPKELLSADEIMKFLNMAPSRKVGTLLEELLTAQLTGDIQTKSDAYGFVSETWEELRD